MPLLEKLTQEFFDATISQETPGGLCFTVAYPLCLCLINNGIDCTLNVGKCEKRDHFWVQVNDESKTIVDITIKQFVFAKNYNEIFIGKMPKEYNHEDIPSEWFINTYNEWLSPIYTPQAYKEEPRKIDFERLYRVNLKAAIFLNNEIQQLKIQETDFVKHYFFGIFEMIRLMGKENRELYKSINGFETLSKKAVQFYKAQESSRNL